MGNVWIRGYFQKERKRQSVSESVRSVSGDKFNPRVQLQLELKEEKRRGGRARRKEERRSN